MSSFAGSRRHHAPNACGCSHPSTPRHQLGVLQSPGSCHRPPCRSTDSSVTWGFQGGSFTQAPLMKSSVAGMHSRPSPPPEVGGEAERSNPLILGCFPWRAAPILGACRKSPETLSGPSTPREGSRCSLYTPLQRPGEALVPAGCYDLPHLTVNTL